MADVLELRRQVVTKIFYHTHVKQSL